MSTTIEHDGFSITSNTESEAAMRAAVETSDEAAEQSRDSDRDERGAVDAAPDGDAGTSQGDHEALRSAVDAEPSQKRRGNPQARISQATAKQHEAERKAEDLAAKIEARLAALEQVRLAPQEPPRQEPPAPVPAVNGSGKPSWKTYYDQIGTTYPDWSEAQDAYADARDTWNRQQWQAELRQQSEAQAYQSAAQQHLERVNAVKAQRPDYDEAVSSVEDIKVGKVLEDAILRLPNSADVVYWLATHRDEFEPLAAETLRLGTEAAPIVKRLLEARVGAGVRSGSASGAELSKAKPPVRPVGVSSVVVPDEPGDDEPFDRYFARQNAIDRKKGKL